MAAWWGCASMPPGERGRELSRGACVMAGGVLLFPEPLPSAPLIPVRVDAEFDTSVWGRRAILEWFMEKG